MPDAIEDAPWRPGTWDRLFAATAAFALVVLSLWPVPVTAAPSVPPSPGPSTPSSASAAPSAPASSGVPAPGPSMDLGLRLYQQQCASCHGQQGQGTQRGPTLAGVGAASVDFMLSTGRMPYQNQRQFMQHNASAFQADEIRALTDYVGSFGGGGPQIPQVRPGDAARGRSLYQEHCAACHSSTGSGGALTGGRIAPPLSQATPTQVGEAIRTGPYVMPQFPTTVLSDQDVNDIAGYVQVLQNEHGDLDRGGFSFGRIGPFTEGAIAWGIGILLLVLFARLLGSRSE